MARLLLVATHGSENPTKAALPFIGAKGAIEAGHEAQIVLMGDAVVLMKDAVANSVTPVGWPPLKELLQAAIQNNIAIYVWGGCSVARAVTEDDLKGKNARFTTPKEFADLAAAATNVITI